MLYQDNYFAVSVKLNFCQRQAHCIDDQDKVQSVTDTDNEFTECQTPRKSSNQLAFNLSAYTHSFMETLKSDISEACKVQVDCLKDSESNYYEKNDMKERVNDLVRLHKVIQ